MYERIKDKSISGYQIPQVLDDTLCDLLATNYNVNKAEKYNALAYESKIKRNIVQRISNLFANTATTADYENNELFYALYYLPLNMYKIWVPLKDLLSRKALRSSIEVLELGAGPGTSTFGLLEFYRHMAEENTNETFSVAIDIVEKEQGFITIFETLLDSYIQGLPINLNVTLGKVYCKEITDDFSFLTDTKYDLIYASNMFNSNERYGNTYFIECCKKLKLLLKEKSSLIFIEPGEKVISTHFKNSRNAVEQEKILQIFSPCCCLFNQEHKRCNCFSIAHLRNIKSKVLNFLAELGLRSIHNGTHSFDYVVFRNDNLKKFDVERKKRIRLSEVDWSALGQTVNVTAIVLSEVKKTNRTGLMLCDGTISGSVWLNLSDEDIKIHNIQTDLIRGEKIDLKGAETCGKLKLKVTNRTEITVSY